MLVNYSDSESETEAPQETAPAAIAKPTKPSKATFQAVQPGRIKIDLPSVRPEAGTGQNGLSEGPPAKRARTGGAFSGFNSLLPPPKRTAQTGLKKGVSLKTSSEAAFSRTPVAAPVVSNSVENESQVESAQLGEQQQERSVQDTTAQEPKLVGKATRFMPLSVSRKKKPMPKSNGISAPSKTSAEAHREVASTEALHSTTAPPKNESRSLFSISKEEAKDDTATSGGVYETMLVVDEVEYEEQTEDVPTTSKPVPAQIDTNSLDAIASDLNLTAAQRRHLLGRQGRDAKVAHFNMDAEYASNEQLRQSGESVEHRAIKAIAPGKHNLQQLINNAKSQKEAMEDAWAEGKRNRGEGGSRYGWSLG